MLSRRGFFGVTLGLWAGAMVRRKVAPAATRPVRTHYVDPRRGSDGNVGTIERPVRSLSEAFRRVENGDTIFICPS